jgi:thiol-disulfide isomerase/thioredoxin
MAAAIILATVGVTGQAAEGKLKVGDPAPKLQVGKWIQGEPVKDFEKGKAYIVEFWATWCPPCRTSIPHLTEVQKKFKDKGVVVVGVSTEKPTVVKAFVEKQANNMAYTVAIDDGGKTSKGYMTAYGQNGIPHAFIVGKNGKIVWHGHPMDGLEKAIDKALASK